MGRLPRIGAHEDADPHVFILGAGASVAACPAGDRYGHWLPVMKNLVDVTGIRSLLEQAGVSADSENFEALYDSLASAGQHGDLLRGIERRIRQYFSAITIPDRPTVYDYLLLGLRPKDLVATFNWDPLLAQAFRRNAAVAPLPRLAFLHGNVAVGYCEVHRRCGWLDDRCESCGEPFAPVSLLFPVRSKDYTANPLIANEWHVLRDHVERAYLLTVFGYSAPRTDVRAREALMTVWQLNGACELAEVEIIDLRASEELHENWKDFITRNDYGTDNSLQGSYLYRHPRRSCNAFAAATLEQRPFKDDLPPPFQDLQELQHWLRPLLEEETELAGSSRQFSGAPCEGHGTMHS